MTKLGRRRAAYVAARALVVALTALALGFLLPTSPARADGLVVASEPMEHQEVDAAPGWVTLAFGDVVDASVAKMLVLDQSGHNVTTGQLIVEGTNMTSQLRDDLPRGTYTVQYRIDRPDGEPQGGAFQFSYGPGSWTTLDKKQWSGSAEEPDVMKNTDPNATTPQGPEPSTSTSVPEVEGGESGGPTLTPNPGPTTASAATPTATASPGEPVPATDQATAQPTTEPTGQPQPPDASPTTGMGALPWIIGGVVVLAAIAAGTVALARRGRYRP